MISLQAATRLMAVKAEQKAAIEFLQEVGFRHLQLKSEDEEIIKFHYIVADIPKLKEFFGDPLPDDNPRKLIFDFKPHGQIVVWTAINTVTLKNSGLQQLPRVAPIPVHEPQSQPPQKNPENVPGSKDNDDSKVPKTPIPPSLSAMYKKLGSNGSGLAKGMFMKQLWEYFNAHKFNGGMKIPRIGLMKDMGAEQMRIRGYWKAYTREFMISPRLFNAEQDFFTEIFLHEMCHQAVSEIDKVVDRTEQGHGPNWQAWMRRVGLNPRRFDPNDNSTYFSKEERKQKEVVDTARSFEEDKLEKLQKRGAKYVSSPSAGTEVYYIKQQGAFGKPELTKGFVLGKKMSKGSYVMAVASAEQVAEYVSSGTLRWWNFPVVGGKTKFYTCDENFVTEAVRNEMLALFGGN